MRNRFNLEIWDDFQNIFVNHYEYIEAKLDKFGDQKIIYDEKVTNFESKNEKHVKKFICEWSMILYFDSQSKILRVAQLVGMGAIGS